MLAFKIFTNSPGACFSWGVGLHLSGDPSWPRAPSAFGLLVHYERRLDQRVLNELVRVQRYHDGTGT